MLDLFLYSDLFATDLSVRGELDLDGVHDLVRLVDRLSNERTVVIDLASVSTDEAVLEVLRTALHERAHRGAFRVIEPVVAARTLDAA